MRGVPNNSCGLCDGSSAAIGSQRCIKHRPSMKGMPNNPVPCSVCGDPWGFPKDGLCPRCRNQRNFRKYAWTPQLDAELRRIYERAARERKALSAALRAFRNRLRWPAQAITDRAMFLRITCFTKHPWSPADEELLRSLARVRSVTYIGKRLKRSRKSIQSKLWSMHLSGRVMEGYTREEMAELFGVGGHTIDKWLDHGWLKRSRSTGRIPEDNVRKFLREHAEQYDLRRIDQAWFKGLIFEGFGMHAHGMGDNAPAPSPYQEVA